MKQFIPPGRSLKYYGLLSWVVPAVIAVVACGVIFIGFASYSLRSERKRLETELSEKSLQAARRVSAELLLGDRGAPDAVLKLLREELALTDARLSPISRCSDAEYCFDLTAKTVTITRKIPAVGDRFLIAELPAPDLTGMLNLRTLFWASFPVILMFMIGIVFHRYIFRRYILSPVQDLVETSTGNRSARTFWPEEIQSISEQLAQSFQHRDQEVFAQIARGVIHDLRTLIHAPLASVDLVDEVQENPEKRARRLESLKTICSQQLPKMREIIDHTLDGSRDVSVKPEMSDVKDTIQGSLRTLEPLIKQSKTKLSLECAVNSLAVSHDRLQLERAVTNLVKNAIEACQEKPVENREIRISLETAHDQVLLSIEDSGPGLRLAPNKTFKTLKSTKAHGSGLGLVVSRKIVEAHGGILEAGQSNTLGGARFVVSLSTGGAQ